MTSIVPKPIKPDSQLREGVVAVQGSRPHRAKRIGVIAERRYLQQAQPRGMIAALSSIGCTTVVVDPEAACHEPGNDSWLQGFDVVVARGRSWAVLSLLSWAEARGVPSLNTRAAIASVHNKADMAVALKMAGIPTPVTRFGSPRELARRVPRADFPLILKPVFGDNGDGLRIVQNAAELATLPWPDNVVLAQKFEPNDGYDLKLYCIGEELWVVRKPSGAISNGAANRAAERVQTTARLRSLARQCGELFGLDLYGVDCIETPTGVVVIEVNDFPNYSAVPKASEKLAVYVSGKIGQRGLA